MLQHTESIAALSEAIALAQAEVENATKGSVNPAFKSKYADLAEVLNTVRPVFSKHGIAITQHPQLDNGVVTVTTLLSHKSGEWMASDCSAPVSKHDAQGVGSAITYCRRYALAALTGVAQEDDDGNSAVGNAAKGGSGQQVRPAIPLPPPSALAAAKERYKEAKEKAFAKLLTTMDEPTAREHLGNIESATAEQEKDPAKRAELLIAAMMAIVNRA
jgi:hypothetical protein